MRKRLKSKLLASLLVISMVIGNVSGVTLPVFAQSNGGDYMNYDSSQLVAEYDFGSEVTEETVYTPDTGYGFYDVEYQNPAAGWVNNVYYPRVPVCSGGAIYVKTVSGSSISEDALEISSKVWNEKESSGYGVYTYENTSVFQADLENADYTVSVTFVNPTDTAYKAYLEAEEITKVTDIGVAPGETVERTFTAVLVDGHLDLKFLAASSASQEDSAVMGKVFVKKISIVRQASNQVAEKPTIFIASDSTVQTYESNEYPKTGWGQLLYSFFGEFVSESEAENCTYNQAQKYETKNVVIENRSIGGRSSKSFIEEGKLDDLLEDVKPGDYVLVQWGHNDATYSRPNRYVSAADFPIYLKYYIDGCRQRGATCVLVTPVARYSPNTDGTFNSNFEAYRQAMITLGREENVPVLDLTEASLDLCESYGIEGAKSLFLILAAGDYEGAYAGGITDATHLQYYGAFKFAQCVAKLIQQYTTDDQLNTLKTYVDLNLPTTVPAQVTNLATSSIGATSVSFTWDSVEGAELYYIYRAELKDGQTVGAIDFTNAEKYSVSSVAKYTDKNCVGGKTYVYAVRAFNEYGLGELSQNISVTTKTSLYKYDFCYEDSNPTMEGWNSVHCKQQYSAELGYGWISAPNGGRYRGNNGKEDSSPMADDFCLGKGEFAVDLPNGDYEIKIYAGDLLPGTSTIKVSYYAEGTSIGTISARQSIGTLNTMVRVLDGQLNVSVGGSNNYINGMEITPILLAPSNLTYSELEFKDANVTFLINFDGIDEAVSYGIYQKSSTDEAFSLVKTVAAKDKDTLDARAMAARVGETREYYVTAVTSDGGESAPCKSITIEMTDPNKLPPAKPVNLTCVSASRANIEIKWDAVEGAVYYNVYRSDKPEGSQGYTGYKKIGEALEASFIDTSSDLVTNIHYYYKVEAVGYGGIGELSEALETPITEALERQKAEHLTDRALVAIDLSGEKGAEINVTTKDAEGKELTSGVYLSWRLFKSDPEDVTFTVYRNDKAIATGLTVTNCVDPKGTSGDIYKVIGSPDDGLNIKAVETHTWENYFIEMQLDQPENQTMPDGTTCSYTANDMSVGDLNNDGDYELIVKWYPSNAKDNAHTGYSGSTILDAYDINTATGEAQLLWRIDLGVNIRSGAHYTQFQVWDFDGDGSAELICKTADGSTAYQNIDGALTETGYVGACNADSLPSDTISTANDYRNTSGRILEGPEYITIFDGETGKIIDTTDYIPGRGSVTSWGDNTGNRVDRFLSAVAYLDGENPSAVFCRGYYTRTCLTAYDFTDTNKDGIGDKLSVRWKFDTNDYPKETYGETTGQGNHGLSINDVDHDGKDEIIYGALVIENDGGLKYCTGLGHGDAMHVSDWIPSKPGLEVFSVHEHTNAKYQVEIRDAETGKIYWGYFTGKDTGRGVAADIDPTYEGAEMWANSEWNGNDGGLYSSLSTMENFVKIDGNTPDVNFSLFWDGDFLSELQDHTFNESDYVPISTNITKWNYINKVPEKLFESAQIYTSNGTKGNMGLVADLLGDWREEIIGRSSSDDSKIRIYTSTITTDYMIPCLMENSAYRIGIAWQNVGYNQPANLDYLLSAGIKTAELTLDEVKKTSIAFHFTAASDGIYGDDVEGYEVYRGTNLEDIKLIEQLPPETLSFTDKTVTPDMNYSYYVAPVVNGRTSFLSKPLVVNTLVDIKSVSEFELEDIVEDTKLPENGTVADLLPSVLEVIDREDNLTTAAVTWDIGKLDITEPGEYTVQGRILGYPNLIVKTVKVVPNTILSYAFTGYAKTGEEEPYFTKYVVQNTNSLELPGNVTFSFLNGSMEEAAVSWDTSAVDVTTKGAYVAVGTTDELTTSDHKFGIQKVKMKVEVRGDYIVGFEELNSIETEIGSTVEEITTLLPTSVTVNYESGNKDQVNVTWNTNIDENLLQVQGNFNVTGTVENFSEEVFITVYVDYPAVWKFDFGIESGNVENGWTGVTVNPKGGSKSAEDLGIVYSNDKGYGFSNSSAVIQGRYEGYTQKGILPPYVYNDFVLPDGQTFLADVPDGTYEIEFSSGSAYKSSVKVTVEDSTSVLTVSNSEGTYNLGRASNVVVSDGQISMFFAQGNVSRLNAIIIRKVSQGDVTPTPTITPTPTTEPTVTPVPTATPTPTPITEPTITPVPTAIPTPTPTTEPTVTPVPTATPTPTTEPTVTPIPTAVPSPTTSPTPTVKPEPTDEATPTTEPTAIPTSTPALEPVLEGTNIKGWTDIIAFIDQLKENEQKDFIIISGQNKILPKEVILAFKGKDVTLEIQCEGYSWRFNGKDIIGEHFEDMNLFIIKNTKAVQKSVIDSVAGENEYITLQLPRHGDFGLIATLLIDLDKENKNKIANLFYYDATTKTLKLQTMDKVDQRGRVSLRFTHASDYVIVFADHVLFNDNVLYEEEIKEMTAAPSTDTLYLGGHSGKTTMIKTKLPTIMEEAIDSCLVKKKITYQSSDKNVAIVAANGKIIAQGCGRTTITTTITVGDVTKTITFDIKVDNASIKIIKKTNRMKVGEKYQFIVECKGYKTSEISYKTTKKSILWISKKTGNAKAVSKGTDYVIITCGGITEKIKVTVK